MKALIAGVIVIVFVSVFMLFMPPKSMAAESNGPTAEAKLCEFYMDDVVRVYTTAGIPVLFVDEADMPEFVANLSITMGETFEGVTRAFMVDVRGQMLVGIEVDGCLLPPIFLSVPITPARLSGRVGLGTHA